MQVPDLIYISNFVSCYEFISDCILVIQWKGQLATKWRRSRSTLEFTKKLQSSILQRQWSHLTFGQPTFLVKSLSLIVELPFIDILIIVRISGRVDYVETKKVFSSL